MDSIYKERLELIKGSYNQRVGARDIIVNRNIKAIAGLENTKESIETSTKVLALLQQTSDEARNKAREHLEDIVTNALQYVSGEDYEFKIEIVTKAGRPEAEFYVVSEINGVETKMKPQDACGGGFVDIISTALRYAYLELFNSPKLNGPILLDEPGKMVSEQASVKFSEFVKQLGQHFNRQTIIITHNDSLQNIADRTNSVRLQSNGESVVEEADLSGGITI